MRLKLFKAEGYKNLLSQDLVSFDFSNCDNHSALIGLNGSGKSNIIEALSIVFSSLYHNRKSRFEYELIYDLAENTIRILNGDLFINGATKKISKKEVLDFLPENVIASYSGEELRMWEEIYEDSYVEFFRDIKKQTSFIPKLLYINKYSWEFALIALMCSEDPKIKNFISKTIGIKLDEVNVRFSFDEESYGLYENNEALSLIKRLNELQRDSKENSIPIQTIRTLDLNHQDNADFTKKVFYYLFITGMPVQGDKIKANKIITSTDIEFNGIDVKKLSEGEKKLILVQTITNVLADERTLVLLDEPDAHIHIDRKGAIVDVINQSNCFTLFSTHSPKILSCINEDHVKVIKNSSASGVEVVKLNKIDALSEITGGEFSIVDATLAISTSKDILLVEGEYDYLYINEAIARLNKLENNKYGEFDFLIINCGGAGNVPAIFREIIAPNLQGNQFCIATFDKDKSGEDGIKGIKKYLEENPMSNVEVMTHTTLPDWEEDKEFFIEDYFPVDVYKQILLDDINQKHKIKDFQQLSKNTVKTIINSNFKKFDDSDFKNFELLLDDITNKQKAFKTQAV